jgi:hypothetical protein
MRTICAALLSHALPPCGSLLIHTHCSACWLLTPHPPPPTLQGYDLLEEIYSTKTAATNFVTIVCQRKPKTFLDKFMAHVVRAFNTYKVAAAAGPVPPTTARTMDGALLAVGALNDTLKQQVCG